MNDDTISRRAAIIQLSHNKIGDDDCDVVVQKDIETIKALPSAQPEQKTGEWISTNDGWDGEYFVCSKCGCPWTLIEGSPEDNGMNFCPNCGAYMRGEQDG